MGLDGVNFGKDYAAEFQANGQNYLNEAKTALANAGVTVPVVQQQKTDLNKPIAGAELEHAELQAAITEEQPAAAAETTQTTIPAATETAKEEAAEETTTKSQVYLETPIKKYDKKAIKDAEYDTRKAYYSARLDGKLDCTNEEIAKYAKTIVKIKKADEEERQVYVCDNKAEYKAKKAERDAEFKKLVKEYTTVGIDGKVLSKKEAKEMADSQLYKYTYLKKGFLGIGGRPLKVAKAIKKSQLSHLLYDEDGKLSNEKYHKLMRVTGNMSNGDPSVARETLGFNRLSITQDDYNAQIEQIKQTVNCSDDEAKALAKLFGSTEEAAKKNTAPKETQDSRVSVSESNQAAAVLQANGINVSDRQLRAFARKGGNKDVERNYNPLVHTLVELAAIAGGHAIGSPTFGVETKGAKANSGSNSFANAVTSEAGSSAQGSAGTSTKVKINAGSVLGAAVGGFGQLINTNETPKYTPAIPQNKPTPQTPEVPLCIHNDDCTYQPIEELIEKEVDQAKETCGMDIVKGQSLYDAARDALGNTVIYKNGTIGDKNPSQTKRLTNYVKSLYGVKPEEGMYGRTHFEFPLMFENQKINCQATIHGTNSGKPKKVRGRANNGNFNPGTEKVKVQDYKYGIEGCGNLPTWYESKAKRDEAFGKLTSK